MRKQKNSLKYFDYIDIPVVAFIGTALGFYIVGFIQTTLGALFDAGEGVLFSWKSITAGMICIVLSVVVLIIAYLYWTLIPKRLGVVYPAITGFGTIIALMALFSSAMLGAEICSYLIYRH